MIDPRLTLIYYNKVKCVFECIYMGTHFKDDFSISVETSHNTDILYTCVCLRRKLPLVIRLLTHIPQTSDGPLKCKSHMVHDLDVAILICV